MTLVLKHCEDRERWDQFVSNSPHGNVFCRSLFLDALRTDIDLLMLEDNGQPQVGAVVVKRDGRPICAPHPCTMYQGVLIAESYLKMPVHQRVPRVLNVLDCLIRELESRYDRISLCLSPRFEDLRSFSWFHYHEPDLGRFKIELYYTGLVDLTSPPDFETYLGSIRRNRRREHLQAVSQHLRIEESQEIDTLDHLHRLTYARQGVERDAEEGRLLRTISRAALAGKFGELLVCRNENNQAIACTLFLYDERCAYSLFAGNDPEFRNADAGTFLLLENIRRCQSRGLTFMDFCGMNSPRRGDFKAGFNAAPAPYFVVTWDSPRPSNADPPSSSSAHP